MLRAVRPTTSAASEIPPRDGHGACSVYGTLEQRSRAERAIRIAAARGSMEAVTADFAQSHTSPLESLATEQPLCGFVDRVGLASLRLTWVTVHLPADTGEFGFKATLRMSMQQAFVRMDCGTAMLGEGRAFGQAMYQIR